MSEAPASPVSPLPIADRLILGYEDLRRQVLGGVGAGRGCALFLRQGMRSWIEAWQDTWRTPPDAPRERDREPMMPAQVRADVVLLLASMVLHHQPEVMR